MLPPQVVLFLSCQTSTSHRTSYLCLATAWAYITLRRLCRTARYSVFALVCFVLLTYTSQKKDICVWKEPVMIICCQSKVFANERGAEVRSAQGHICIKLMIACKWTKFLSEERGIHPLGAPSCWWSAESHYGSNTITAVSIRRGDRKTRLALLLYYVLCGMAQSGQLH